MKILCFMFLCLRAGRRLRCAGWYGASRVGPLLGCLRPLLRQGGAMLLSTRVGSLRRRQLLWSRGAGYLRRPLLWRVCERVCVRASVVRV